MNSFPSPSPKKNSGLAVASLVCGILSLICLGLLSGIPAVICGHLARGKIKRDLSMGGEGLALAGLIMGYFSIFATVILMALALPAINGALERGRMTQTLSNARQIHLVLEQMALDAKTTGDESLKLPADAGIRSVEELKKQLVRGGYLSAGDMESLEFGKFLIGNVSAADPAGTIVIRSKPEAYPNGAIIFMQKDGNGRLLTKRQLGQMTAQDPPREPAYLPEQ